MTDIRTETVPLVDGTELRLTVAEPDSAIRAGIVVLHEARGVTDATRLLVQTLAAEGYLVVAPHLYHRDGADELDGEHDVTDQVSRLDGGEVLADTDTAFGWLADRHIPTDRMGVIGFDVGGSVALLVAAQRTLGAAVTVVSSGIVEPVSGKLPSLFDIAPELACPWLGLYGEPPGESHEAALQKLRDAAASSRFATDLVTYSGTPYPIDSDRGGADAWTRVLNWFDSHLR